MALDPQFPWMFHRNEVDLLEEDLDDIYEQFKQEEPTPSIEDDLIEEQIQTEEYAEAEISMRMEPSWLMSKSSRTKDAIEFDTTSLRLELAREAERPPMYRQSYVWAQTVFLLGKEMYEKNFGLREDAFRMFLNAKMIPIKLSNAMIEESHDDPLSQEIAENEYRLTIVYVTRVLEPLVKFQASFQDPTLLMLVQNGEKLKRALLEYVHRFGRRKQGSPNKPL